MALIFITFTFMNRWGAIGRRTAMSDIGIAVLTFAESFIANGILNEKPEKQ